MTEDRRDMENPAFDSEFESTTQDDASAYQPPDLDALNARLGEAEQEREQFRRLLQRTQADFINYRKRAEEEKREQEQVSNARLVRSLLPVVDDFQLAMDHASQDPSERSWREGFELIYRKLLSILEAEGIVRIEVLGKQFDPFEHEAIAYREAEGACEGTVVEVLQAGYKIHGKVLRPARVVVAKGANPMQED